MDGEPVVYTGASKEPLPAPKPAEPDKIQDQLNLIASYEEQAFYARMQRIDAENRLHAIASRLTEARKKIEQLLRESGHDLADII